MMQVLQAMKLGTCCGLEKCETHVCVNWKRSEKHATCRCCITVNAVAVWMSRLAFCCSSNECQHSVTQNSWHRKNGARCVEEVKRIWKPKNVDLGEIHSKWYEVKKC